MLIIDSVEKFDQTLKENKDKLIIIDFFATWCGPCKMIAPKLKAMEEEFKSVLFCTVDVDDASEVAEKEGIQAMPTFKFYKGGEEVEEIKGASEPKIREALTKYSS
ncbi:thioredoxin isoform X1 [Octopus sinensis]|uniref:Thioredoxin n=1 Tax=Octopus sinensis TaxID=2607531 RepID=A0A6P7TBA9_9MOLL|nr:thioredoxin isoform X1 [Octopus sinensis]